MKKYFNILKKCPLFNNIEDEKLLIMLECLGARIEFFDKKYTIFAEDKPAKLIGILLSGSAQITNVDYYGNRNILSKVSPSEVFGEAFACVGTSALPVTVTADEPSEVMFISSERFLTPCSNNCEFHQQLILNLIKSLSSKLIMLQQKIEITSKRSTEEKLMAYLMLYAQKTNSSSFDIPFDRQELADYLGVERSGLSAEISKLRKAGIIESNKSHFVLL